MALNDSPAGLLAWIIEKFRAWSDCDGDPENAFTRDQLLTNVMLYWVTRTITSSARLYREARLADRGGKSPQYVGVPTGVGRYPKEVLRFPRPWVEQQLQRDALGRHAARRPLRRDGAARALRRRPAYLLPNGARTPRETRAVRVPRAARRWPTRSRSSPSSATSAKVLAGGQSLVPMLALRLAVFEHLVDVGRIAELRGIERRDGELWIGAGTTQARSARTPRSRPRCRCSRGRRRSSATSRSATAARSAGRSRTPIPAGEYPAVALALDASMEVVSAAGRRRIAARDFFEGFWTTSMQPDELLAGVTFPIWNGRCGFAVEEFARRHGDFAIAGAAIGVELDADDRIRRCAHRADRPRIHARTGRGGRSGGRPADASPTSTPRRSVASRWPASSRFPPT